MSDDYTDKERAMADDIVNEALLGQATGPERAAAQKTALLSLKLMRGLVPQKVAVESVLLGLVDTGHVLLPPALMTSLRSAVDRTGFLKGRGGNEQPATRDLKNAIDRILDESSPLRRPPPR